MDLRNLKLAGLLLASAGAACICAQAQTSLPQPYTLIAGSQLTDDCLDCDRIPIVVPMTGTFNLHRLHEDPLFTHYELRDISFHAGTNPGPEYQVVGSGTYQMGGQVAVQQDMFLNLEISNSVAGTKALCVNPDRFVAQPWPKLQIDVRQTNGTSSQVYYLTLIAVPIPTVRVLLPGDHSGDLRLEWEGNGAKFQLERATNAAGLYEPLTPKATESPFTDAGVITNQAQFFYRLRQF
jgi:hypothetical protein